MKEKSRCSILFHLLVPGGRWLTTMSRPSSLASLQFAFPQPHPPAVAAAAVRGDQQAGGVGVTRLPEVEPPLADAVDREGGGVVVDADTDPAGIRGKIIDAIGHRTTKFLDQEIVDPDRFRISLRPIFPAMVAEVADQFLLLGVD